MLSTNFSLARNMFISTLRKGVGCNTRRSFANDRTPGKSPSQGNIKNLRRNPSTTSVRSNKANDSEGRNPPVETKIQFRKVEKEHHLEVIQHNKDYFFKNEPLCRLLEIHKDRQASAEVSNLLQRMLDQDMSAMAVNTSNSKIVGTVICCDESNPSKPTSTHPKIQEMLDLQISLQQGVDLNKRFGISTWLGVFFLSVDPEYQGLKLGHRLSRLTRNIADDRAFEGIMAFCSAIQSQKIFAELGFKNVMEIKYADYITKKNGLLNPGPPHESIKLMAAPATAISAYQE